MWYNKYTMTPQDRDRISQVRQKIRLALQSLCGLVERLLAVPGYTPGSLYLWKHRCGRPGCHCATGTLHEHWVLSYPRGGKLRKRYLLPEELERVGPRVETYRQFRRTRRELVESARRLSRLLDALEKVLPTLSTPPKQDRP